MRSNSSRTAGLSQLKSGWEESNRCRYHWPGVPSGLVTRVQAGPPKWDCQLFGGSFAVGAASVPEDEHVPGRGAGFGGQGRLEEGVLVGAVVGNQVHDDPDAVFVGAGNQGVEVVQRAEDRIHGAVVGDVVAGILLRRPVEGREPDGVDRQFGQGGDLGGDAGQVADAVAAQVAEGPRVDLVDDRGTPPFAAGRGLVDRDGAQVLLGRGVQLVWSYWG